MERPKRPIGASFSRNSARLERLERRFRSPRMCGRGRAGVLCSINPMLHFIH
jgi:hypothetical protein